MKDFKRISIIGPNGAGKTRLARILHKKLSLSIVHMDAYIWGPHWELSERSVAEEKIKAELKKDFWIAEGYLTYAPQELLQLADVVIYLKYSHTRAFLHNIKRWIQHRKVRREELPVGCEETFSPRSWWSVWRGGITPLITEALQKYPPRKLIKISSPKNLKIFLKQNFGDDI